MSKDKKKFKKYNPEQNTQFNPIPEQTETVSEIQAIEHQYVRKDLLFWFILCLIFIAIVISLYFFDKNSPFLGNLAHGISDYFII
jgi:hypothetical protein